MKCCGDDCQTPFCPKCGKALPKSGIAGLLAHVKSQAQQHATRLKDAEKSLDSEKNKDRIEWRKRGVEKCLKQSAKWDAWLAALEALINEPKQ